MDPSDIAYATFLLILVLQPVSCGIVDWIWGSSNNVDVNKQHTSYSSEDFVSVNVPYEAKSGDEKFLEEAKKYTDIQLSELDTCQHKVIMKIRTSCSEMTSEELAKLSVNLLNCQSAVEGREQFPCTDSMSLRQCTKNMSPDVWNSYHLMNNRARAVCYSARHQQFRALTEMTVNKLMGAAHDQIGVLNKIKYGQEQLKTITTDTLQKVAEGQDSLLLKQDQLKTSQLVLQSFVGQNMRDLVREKALIAAGHEELARLTNEVRGRIDAANSQLAVQQSERQLNHQELLNDLDKIQEHAKVIWKEIAESKVQYDIALQQLLKINATVGFLIEVIENTRIEIDNRLGWISVLLGGTGNKIAHLCCMVQHGIFLLISMLVASFLGAPFCVRICLVAVVPLNLSVVYNHGEDSALTIPSMAALVTIFYAVNSVITYISHTTSKDHSLHRVNGSTSSESVIPVKLLTIVQNIMVEIKYAVKKLLYYKTDVSEKERQTSPFSDYNHSTRTHCTDPSTDSEESVTDSLHSNEPMKRVRAEILSNRRSESPLRFRYPTPPISSRASSSRSGTPLHLERNLCQAVCRTGTPCRNTALPGSIACWRHSNERE